MGGDLLTLLKEEPGLSEDSVRGFGQDLALALQHAHTNGLVSLCACIKDGRPTLWCKCYDPAALTSNADSCTVIWGCTCCVCSRLGQLALLHEYS